MRSLTVVGLAWAAAFLAGVSAVAAQSGTGDTPPPIQLPGVVYLKPDASSPPPPSQTPAAPEPPQGTPAPPSSKVESKTPGDSKAAAVSPQPARKGKPRSFRQGTVKRTIHRQKAVAVAARHERRGKAHYFRHRVVTRTVRRHRSTHPHRIVSYGPRPYFTRRVVSRTAFYRPRPYAARRVGYVDGFWLNGSPRSWRPRYYSGYPAWCPPFGGWH